MATRAPGSHTSQSWPSIFIGKINITSNRLGERDKNTLFPFNFAKRLAGCLAELQYFGGSCKIRFNDWANFYVAI